MLNPNYPASAYSRFNDDSFTGFNKSLSEFSLSPFQVNPERDVVRTFSFIPGSTSAEFPNMGSVNHHYLTFSSDGGGRIKTEFTAGLAIQNTIMNLYAPNYQLSLKASISYPFNDWIGVFLYGQYLTSPLNKADDYFDPFIYDNPLFLQNETGAGTTVNHNKNKIDFQIYTIYGTDLKSPKPLNSRLRLTF